MEFAGKRALLLAASATLPDLLALELGGVGFDVLDQTPFGAVLHPFRHELYARAVAFGFLEENQQVGRVAA